jgi:hypothetical protein
VTWPDVRSVTANCTPTAVDKVMRMYSWQRKISLITVISLSSHISVHLFGIILGLVIDWKTGIEATELPPRLYLDLKIAGPLCAAI